MNFQAIELYKFKRGICQFYIFAKGCFHQLYSNNKLLPPKTTPLYY